MRNYLSVIIVVIFCSCQFKQHARMKDFSKNDTIKVFFFPGIIETNVRIKCKDLSLTCKEENAMDSVISIDSVEFNKILNFVANKKRKVFEKYEEHCDCRIVVNHKDKYVCFGEGRSSSELNADNLEMSYFIKSKVGYFDYFSESDLQHSIEIQNYGIPATYHYYRHQPHIITKEAVTVLLVLNTTKKYRPL